MASVEAPLPPTAADDRPEDRRRVESPSGSPKSSQPDHSVQDRGTASPGSGPMGPPNLKSTNGKRSSPQKTNGDDKPSTTANTSAPIGAAAASQQPKIVQTAFIHKLYNMLEDQSIQHLISWSSSGESFLISPSSEFSKVLSSYFKHTNVSSFVRQLNMYGFHKVSDVFQTGSPDSPLWEFKHGNGNFKRGDLTGLREIKRRASRHTLIHRDSFSSAPKGPVTTNVSTTAETMPETLESRLAALEQALWDSHGRLTRSEDSCAQMTVRCHNVHEHLVRALQLNYDMSNVLISLATDRNSSLYHSASSIHNSVAARLEQAKRDFEGFYGGLANPRPPISVAHEDGLSPRARPQQDHRLDPIPPLPQPTQPGFYRPLAPSSRGLGSFSGPSSAGGPSSLAPIHPPQMALQPVHQHPLAAPSTASSAAPMTSYMPRRHTSADIRSDGWVPDRHRYALEPSAGVTTPNRPSVRWPSPGLHTPGSGGDQLAKESVARPAVYHHTQPVYEHESGPSTPPHARNNESRWHALGGKIPFKDVFKNTGVKGDTRVQSPGSTSGPPTRRSSVANIHMMLNPADVAEKDGEEDTGPGSEEMRKRRRVD